MQPTDFRRPAALAFLLTTLTLAAAGCDRRPTDPTQPQTSPGSTSSTTPSNTNPGGMSDRPASAASR